MSLDDEKQVFLTTIQTDITQWSQYLQQQEEVLWPLSAEDYVGNQC